MISVAVFTSPHQNIKTTPPNYGRYSTEMASENSVMAVIRASRPSFRNAHDKVAFVVHAIFLASDHALVATGSNAFSEQSDSSGVEEVGIEGWNQSEDSYGFVYVKMEKEVKKKVVVKCLAIEDVLAIDAVNLGADNKEPSHLQIKIMDYLSGDSGGTGNYVEMYKNFAGLVKSLKKEILDKLNPPPASTKLGTFTSNARHGRLEQEPNAPSLGIPVETQPHSTGVMYPPVLPSDFSDIDPGLGAGVFPTRGGVGGGNMFVGPNDPRWFAGPGQPGGFGGIPGVPPGARFDPYGPPGVPGFEPNPFIRQPRRPGRDTHPDLHHFHDSDYI